MKTILQLAILHTYACMSELWMCVCVCAPCRAGQSGDKSSFFRRSTSTQISEKKRKTIPSTIRSNQIIIEKHTQSCLLTHTRKTHTYVHACKDVDTVDPYVIVHQFMINIQGSLSIFDSVILSSNNMSSHPQLISKDGSLNSTRYDHEQYKNRIVNSDVIQLKE